MCRQSQVVASFQTSRQFSLASISMEMLNFSLPLFKLASCRKISNGSLKDFSIFFSWIEYLIALPLSEGEYKRL